MGTGDLDVKKPRAGRGERLCKAFGVFGVLTEFGEERFGKIIPRFFPKVVAYGRELVA